MSEDMELQRLQGNLESARAGMDFATAGRQLHIDRAREEGNINMALYWIKKSTAPNDAWEARQFENFQKAHNELLNYLKAKNIL